MGRGEVGIGSTKGTDGLHLLQQGRWVDGQHAGTHLPRRRPECARRCLPLVTIHVSRLWTLSRGSYLRQRRDWSWGTHGGRPVLRVLRPTVVRPFESDLEHAAQGHAEVRIGVTTCHQGNPSMPDAAVAHRELVRVHGPRDRASSPPRRSALLGSPLGVHRILPIIRGVGALADPAASTRSFYVSIRPLFWLACARLGGLSRLPSLR